MSDSSEDKGGKGAWLYWYRAQHDQWAAGTTLNADALDIRAKDRAEREPRLSIVIL